MIISILRKAHDLYKEESTKKKEIKEKADIAKAFNARYTYDNRYFTDTSRVIKGNFIESQGGFAWMCPECNKIHEAEGWNVFTGLEYPKCCSSLTSYKY